MREVRSHRAEQADHKPVSRPDNTPKTQNVSQPKGDTINISREASEPEDDRPVPGLDTMTGWLAGDTQAQPQLEETGESLDQARAVTSHSKSAVSNLAELGERNSAALPEPAANAAKTVNNSPDLARLDKVLGPAGVISNGLSTVEAARDGDVAGTVSSGGFTLSSAGATAQAAGVLPAALKAAPGVVGGGAAVVGGGAKLVDGIQDGDTGKAAEGGAEAVLGGAMIAGAATGNVPLAAGAAVGYLGLTVWQNREAIGEAAGKVADVASDAAGTVAGVASDAANGVADAAEDVVGSIF